MAKDLIQQLKSLDLDASRFSGDDVRHTLRFLLNAVEQLVAENQQLREENQKLNDENSRLTVA